MMAFKRRRAHGFTLLEMVLVLFLVGLMASAALILTEGVEDQGKYDESKRRMDMIRKAIVGDPSRTINGVPEISGFVADMGRLPGCIRELLEPLDCAEPPNPLTLSAIDANSGLQTGWRGPYIAVMPDADGDRRLRDGYENDDGTANFGWGFLNDGTDIRLQTAGYNGRFDGATPIDDYPAGDVLANVPALVNAYDYTVNFQNWDSVTIRFENSSGTSRTIGANSLRLVLSYADDTQANALGAIDSMPFPATDIVVPSGSLNVTSGTSATVPAGTSLSDTSGGSMTLTFTTTGNLVFPGGVSVPVISGGTANVPTASTLTGTNLTVGNNGDVTFPAGSAVDVPTAFAGLPDVTGHYSLSIVCHDPANPNTVDGRRFDGDCSRYGTDAAPIAYAPQNQPHVLNAAPRSNPVMPPSPLIWSIQ